MLVAEPAECARRAYELALAGGLVPELHDVDPRGQRLGEPILRPPIPGPRLDDQVQAGRGEPLSPPRAERFSRLGGHRLDPR
jgi:hypothetical protein